MRSKTAPPAAFSPPAIAPINPRRHAVDQELQEARHRFFEAQRHCAHDAGVFVGNLSIRLTDLQLLHEVQRAFGKYGECEVMVNRTDVANGHGKPWAIVQFKVCLHSLLELTQTVTDHRAVVSRSLHSHLRQPAGHHRQPRNSHLET